MTVLFIYMNKIGDIRVEKLDGAAELKDDELWEHIATVDPQKYLQTMLNKYPKIVSALRITAPETEKLTCGTGFDTVADDLAMFAARICEFANGAGALPHPWRIDDWLTDYRSRFARADKVSNVELTGVPPTDATKGA